jgi:hypothetical protein
MRGWLTVLLALAAVAAGAATAGAEPTTDERELAYRIAALDVEGAGGWQPRDSFTVTADHDLRAPPERAFLNYRIVAPDGEPVGDTISLNFPTVRFVAQIPVEPGESTPEPGAYRLEAWLGGTLLRGASAIATLRFDDSRPGPVKPLAPDRWLPAGSAVELRIEHPADPLPPSGIRGYAVELDHGTGAEPCGGRESCSAAETDLDGGEADDSILLGPLAEGINVARVVAVSGTGMRSTVAKAAEIHIDGSPPSIALGGAPRGWSNRPVEVLASASDPLSGMEPHGLSGPVTTISVDGATAIAFPGARATATVHGDGVHQVTASARDAVGNAGAADPAAARATVRIDETPPRLAFSASQDPERPERIVAAVSDALSGPSTERGSIELRPVRSGLPFEPLPTAVSAGRLVAEWGSDSFPRGEYEFRAVGFDAAGNRATSGSRADGAPMVLANPVKTTASLAFGFGGREFVAHRCRRGKQGLRCHNQVLTGFAHRPAAARTGYGRSAPVTGRLTTAAGAPLAGLPVEITESFDAGSETIRRTTTVASGADGFFLTRLAPGPNRRVTVSFAGTPTLTATSGRQLRLGVRTALRLRASSATATVGGAPVVFSGHLGRRGAAVPAGGLPVGLEFRVAGLPWTEFRTVQTDGRGSFRFPYAFGDNDSRGIRFQFRAHLAPQPGWPYDEAYSRPVSVTGR